MYSLFEEQIEAESENIDAALEYGTNSYAESTSYLPDMPKYHVGPDRYLDLLQKAKKSVDIPVIASLNGKSRGGWTRYSQYMEEAGADALELNIFNIPTDPSESAQQLEDGYVELVRSIRSHVKVPISVKLGPYFTSLAHFAKRLSEAGADGVVIFNRFYQPDFDLEQLEVTPNLVLSSPHELRLRLHWAAILYHQVETYIAITGGVHDATDVLKCMMAGANVAMMTSAMLKYGIEHIGVGWLGHDKVNPVRFEIEGHGAKPGTGVEAQTIGEHYASFIQMLSERGFTDDQIALILGGNYLRIWKQILPAA